MLLTVISDTHARHGSLKLPGGDLLIHCGDFSTLGREKEVWDFINWFSKQDYKHKVYIAGNHDRSFDRRLYDYDEILKTAVINSFPGVNYLENSGIEIEGLKIWGSPYQPEFCDWAFNLSSEGLYNNWREIPKGLDILLTHGAPEGILDPSSRGLSCGCRQLLNRLVEMKNPPRFHLFGHLHDGYGTMTNPAVFSKSKTVFVNASICDNMNIPVHNPILLFSSL